MSVTFPLEVRVFTKVTPRWAKRARSSSAGASRFQENDLVWTIPGRRRFAPLPSLAGIAIVLVLRESRLLLTGRLPLYLSRRV
jgi:hypothetical protein